MWLEIAKIWRRYKLKRFGEVWYFYVRIDSQAVCKIAKSIMALWNMLDAKAYSREPLLTYYFTNGS